MGGFLKKELQDILFPALAAYGFLPEKLGLNFL